MNYINFCMKYDTCKRCPLNKKCIEEVEKQEKVQEKEVQKKEEKTK